MVRLPRLALAAAVAAAALPLRAGAVVACATPVPKAQAFSRGSTKTLEWAQGSPPGGGFVIEVADSGALDPDGSFVDAHLFRVEDGVPAGWDELPFDGLDEQRYFYHVRAKAKSGGGACLESPWSSVVETTQDSTPPVLALATENGRVFLAEEVAIEGTAADAPTTAPVASGVGSVVVQLASVSPWGPLLPQPNHRAVTVGPDGSWRATFADAQPSQYRVTATAYDRAGNPSQPAVITVTVVAAPTL